MGICEFLDAAAQKINVIFSTARTEARYNDNNIIYIMTPVFGF
jgi:hypothetical protein